MFKICLAEEWHRAASLGRYDGSALDRADGFIHLSATDQVAETAARHFKGQTGLVLVEVDETKLGASLKWEPSRKGALFPHVYGALPMTAVLKIEALSLDADGVPLIPSWATDPC